MTTIDCNHLEAGRCKLGYHGGKPLPGNCMACVNAGENTIEFSRYMDEIREKSHPSSAPRVSGCCDDARNYSGSV